MKMPALHWQILIALVLAAAVGLGFREAQLFGTPLVAVYDFFGTLFLNALKMLIVPLIVSSIVAGVAGLGRVQGFARLGIKTMGYYLLTSSLAILAGLTFVNALQPGILDGEPARGRIESSETETGAKLEQIGDRDAGDMASVFVQLIPPNIVNAAVEGNMLGLIFFSLLFGYFVTRLDDAPRRHMTDFWQAFNDVMLRMTELIMAFAPIGVFALVAKVTAETGVEAFRSAGIFFITVLLALATHAFITLPILLIALGRVKPWRHYKAMSPAALMAFSTASSSATLPVTMDCVQKRAGVSRGTSSFVLPLGATINMDGTALYECVAAIFIAQAYGIELGFTQQFLVVALALLTSIGVAGIPAASLVAIVIILNATGVPAEGIGLLLATDRILDMLRTSLNVFSDSCGAVIIAKSEGEDKVLADAAEGDSGFNN